MVKFVVPALVAAALASGAAVAATHPSAHAPGVAPVPVHAPAPARVAVRSAPPDAVARGWFTVAENPRGQVSIKADSFTLGEDAASAPVVMATLRLLDRSTHEVLVKEAVIGLGDCEAGAGTLYLANLTDLGMFARWEFAFGAGSIASSAAETLCGVAARGIADAMQADGQAGNRGSAPASTTAPAAKSPPSARQPDPNEI